MMSNRTKKAAKAAKAQTTPVRQNKDASIKAAKASQAASTKPEAAVPLPAAPVKPAAENPLTRSAMLVCVSVHQWGNRVQEQRLSAKAENEHKTAKGVIHTTKRLVPRDLITKVTSAFSRFKAHHYENTSPWDNNGYRILPSANYFKYVEAERDLRRECMDEVEQLCKVWPNIRAAAQKAQGSLFRESDWPTVADFRASWRIETHFMTIPDKADFRVDLPAEELRRINEDIDGQIAAGLKNATHDCFERLHTVVLAMRDKLKEYSVTTDASGKLKTENHFRDTLVTNIRDLCKLLPRLNVTNDPDLARLCAEAAESLGKIEPDSLRGEDSPARDVAIKRADKLLEAMAGYV